MRILFKECYRQRYDAVLEKFSEPRLISTEEFDARGNIIKEEHHGSDAYEISFRHDEYGNQIEEKLYDEEMDFLITITSKYNKENKLISRATNEIAEGYDYGVRETLYRYNNYGLLIETLYISDNFQEVTNIEYHYKENELLEIYYKDGIKIKEWYEKGAGRRNLQRETHFDEKTGGVFKTIETKALLNKANQPLRLEDNEGKVVELEYDAKGNLIRELTVTGNYKELKTYKYKYTDFP